MRIDPARLGKWGEDAACAFLRLKGYRIVARNFRAGRYELDIVAAYGDELVFVEIKVRREEDHGGPARAVGFKKQRDLSRAASAFIADRRPDVRSYRFDVIGIVLSESGEEITLQHIAGAFQSGNAVLFY
jgi:putative endonuclease